ncbi:MAG: hypothetical protein WAN11_17850 [Syntrophobacteraceae bacterium]
MKPYPKYRDSGVAWIGEVPEGWEVKKMKYLTTKIGSGIKHWMLKKVYDRLNKNAG